MDSKELLFRMLTNNANDWVFDEYYAFHKTTNTKWWIANKFYGFESCEPRRIELGYWNTLALYQYLKKAIRLQIIENSKNNFDINKLSDVSEMP